MVSGISHPHLEILPFYANLIEITHIQNYCTACKRNVNQNVGRFSCFFFRIELVFLIMRNFLGTLTCWASNSYVWAGNWKFFLCDGRSMGGNKFILLHMNLLNSMCFCIKLAYFSDIFTGDAKQLSTNFGCFK